jgi:hypothetical protein
MISTTETRRYHNMTAHHHSPSDKDKGYSSSKHLIGAAWGILVMGLSIAAIILIWVWFGHEGPSFSNRILQEQQARLREQYGLPPEPPLPPELLEVPPSLRNLTNITTTGNETADIRPA